jgi:outer membrane protein assembly factor BamB
MRKILVFLTLAGMASVSAMDQSQRTASAAWPQFRGVAAAGVASGNTWPVRWSATTGESVAWKVRIPGLAHSSPIIWGDRLYVTSAVSSQADATFKPGLYGEGTASNDTSHHRWMLYAIDRATGRIVWERVAYEGIPKEKRHVKSTYASPTPATDGRTIVAWFGSQGLWAFDMDGTPRWQKDLGRLDVGAYDLPEYEWGVASSPIVEEGRVYLQVDQQKGSFLLALDSASGKELWRTPREELPSWGTPTMFRPSGGGRPELVTNASNFVRGYDPATGRELWRAGGSSKITAPTPITTDRLVIVASGRAPERPMYAIRAGATGDITPGTPGADGTVAWYKTGRGSYMPTPIVVDGRLYVLSNAGLLDAYDVNSGAEVYRQRIEHQGSGFSASPVAAGGHLYLSSEDGDVFVVKAGAEFAVVAHNPMGEPLMATPALADGTIYVRGERHLFAIKSR